MARLIESTLWVDFTRARTSDERKAKIRTYVLDPEAALCEPVAFEVLRFARPDERGPIEQLFGTITSLPLPPDLWSTAATYGQQCRAAGVTPGSIDLLIATTAIHHDAELITFDHDYADLAKILPLKATVLARE